MGHDMGPTANAAMPVAYSLHMSLEGMDKPSAAGETFGAE